MKKQAGNVVEWLIIGVVLIGAVSLIAWRYMEADKDQNEAERSVDTNQIVPKESNVKLTDWNVEIKPSSKFGKLSAKKEGGNYVISSSKLTDVTYTCTDEANKGKLGTVSRSVMVSTAPVQPTWATFGDQVYAFTATVQADCYEGDSVDKLGEEFSKEFKTLLVASKEQNS